MTRIPAASPSNLTPARRRTRRGLDLTGLVNERFTERFWSKVDTTGDCWIWTRHCSPQGYGKFMLRKGVLVGAHTVSYALARGAIAPGKVICHRCDNPPCVNPDHLFIGTQVDNALDMFAKGRAQRTRGTARANALLNDDAVRHIRSVARYHGMIRDLAAEFGVSTTTIRAVRAGRKWGHVA